ncbi:uncharacterized protein LOC111337471 [Stylophora pistillata]|uniref:uncharacterized protein LOC111337471 n=1 Tax=Stylophora pistillata TaxID=50429 RepID=UPI000C054942|nr:uncharacterized protein LOC111337471 [Stylophora pistillata]
MREDHKLYETNSPVEEMKLVGRPSQDPACLPDDYVPRGSYETLSCKEGKSMGKVGGPSHEQVGIHLCSSGNLGIQDASFTIQPSDGSEGYLHRRKCNKRSFSISRKSHYKMWPQELVEIDCSSPSVHSLMELEESLSCVSANELATGRDVIDHSNHPNNFDVHENQNKGESRCSFMRNNRVTIISFVAVFVITAIVLAIFALVIGKEKSAFPTPEVSERIHFGSCLPEHIRTTSISKLLLG